MSTKNIFLNTQQGTQVIQMNPELEDLTIFKEFIYSTYEINPNSFYLLNESKIIGSSQQLKELTNNSNICLSIKMLGGKGGFGALMKGLANKNTKFQNQDACRNLQGRRIRNVENEKKLKDEFKKQMKEEKQTKKQIDEYKKYKQEEKLTKRDYKLDQKYQENMEKYQKNFSNSIKTGLKQKSLANSDIWSQSNCDSLADTDLTDLSDFHLEQQQIFSSMPEKNKKICKSEDKAEIKKAENNETLFDSILSEQFGTIKDKSKLEPIEEQAQNQQEKKTNENESTNKTTATASEQQNFDEINLDDINSIEDLEKFGADHLKAELTRLGLKCGGTAKMRAERLYQIKLDPLNLFNPKFLAKKA